MTRLPSGLSNLTVRSVPWATASVIGVVGLTAVLAARSRGEHDRVGRLGRGRGARARGGRGAGRLLGRAGVVRGGRSVRGPSRWRRCTPTAAVPRLPSVRRRPRRADGSAGPGRAGRAYRARTTATAYPSLPPTGSSGRRTRSFSLTRPPGSGRRVSQKPYNRYDARAGGAVASPVAAIRSRRDLGSISAAGWFGRALRAVLWSRGQAGTPAVIAATVVRRSFCRTRTTSPDNVGTALSDHGSRTAPRAR